MSDHNHASFLDSMWATNESESPFTPKPRPGVRFGQPLYSLGRAQPLSPSRNHFHTVLRSPPPLASASSTFSSRLTSPVNAPPHFEEDYMLIPRSVPVTRRNSLEFGFYPYSSLLPKPDDKIRKASAPSSARLATFQPFDSLPIDTHFLDDDPEPTSRASQGMRDYLDVYSDHDKFPILVNHGGRNKLSVTSAALDLAPLSSSKDNKPRNRSQAHFGELTSPDRRLERFPDKFPNFDTMDNVAYTYVPATGAFTPTRPHQAPVSDPPITGLCRFYLQGHCTKANRCMFKHVSKADYLRHQSRPKEAPRNTNKPRPKPTARPAPIHIPPVAVPPIQKTPTKMNRRYTESDKYVHHPQLDLRLLSKDFSQHVGSLAALCVDQHGCRFLQKKLEERKPYQTQVIFQEVSATFVELMTDPFGNYLCQKLMEHCNDTQRSRLVEIASTRLVQISLNMHGTRAVQKMLEFLVPGNGIRPAPAIFSIIDSIKDNVVDLIKDLNGNHVIQKCINLLCPEFNQFIYDSVSTHVVEVATHRHGCCVLQRCIDNASDAQKRQLALAITEAAPRLVQDPFGNYVIQYVLDLSIPEYTALVIAQFMGRVCSLSVQKFSSNVIEKCIRNAEKVTRRHLIQELLNRERLDLLIRDSYANYVVQTCLEFAEKDQRAKLVQCIEPLLSSVKGTTYGKRIMNCISRSLSEADQEPEFGPELHKDQPSAIRA
ncbi:hypothetical protein DSO57_1014717 [Entomophthora muscae]|uniref:Uncharacterized protein n=1 Tax=Entomophthora muscae TaxID=34485 RepID=A0ACC2U3M5_9FUNG|nr:hypothetical protein DSO57_1014717 [Entomophthora muscae]